MTQAVLAVSGVGATCGCPAKKRLSFVAEYLPAEREGRAPPYFAAIPLRPSRAGGGVEASAEAAAGQARFRVPSRGQLLLVLSNPEGTPIHTQDPMGAQVRVRDGQGATRTTPLDVIGRMVESAAEGCGRSGLGCPSAYFVSLPEEIHMSSVPNGPCLEKSGI